MQRLIIVCLLALLAAFSARPAFAEKRVALVIGNSAYQNVPRLTNPANDAEAIADMFRAAKFDIVDLRRNLSIAEMRRALRDFSDKIRDVDIAVVYYAGHGLEVEGMNYLIPVDAVLERDRDAYDEAISLDRVLQTIEPARQLRLVILDACRDNPFAAKMQRTIASRALVRGLAGVEPGSPNTLIAFAAKAGSTAEDGTAQHSPFTMSLTKYLAAPGLDIRLALGQVRDDVMKATHDQQEPFVYGSLGGAAVSLVPASLSTALRPTEAASPPADPRRDYELALQLGTRGAWETFLQAYPSGFYAGLAREQLSKIAADQAGASASQQGRQSAALPQTGSAQQAGSQGGSVVSSGGQSAALSIATEKPAGPDAQKIARALQTELRRVGCFNAAVDGDWNSTASKRALDQFNRYARTKFEVSLASADALDAVKGKTERVCPLICEHGFRADADTCVRITCQAGYKVGNNNTCEKIEMKKPVAKQEPASQARSDVKSARAPEESAQVICTTGGCRPVRKGCHIGTNIETAGRIEYREDCN